MIYTLNSKYVIYIKYYLICSIVVFFISYNNMQMASYSQQIADLNYQNEQLKAKYKKSLHELMHILSINKTMKEHMDTCPANQTKINQLQYNIEDLNLKLQMQKIHIKELVGIKYGLEAKVASLQVMNRDVEIEKQRLKKQLAQSLKRLKFEQERRKQMQHQQQISGTKIKRSEQIVLLKTENQKLGKAVLKYKGIEQQNRSLSKTIQQLQQEIKFINIEQNNQRQRWKNKMATFEKEIESVRSTQLQKTRDIQSKYSILQAQISNYQQIENFIEESRRIEQDQMLFKNIQTQIEKINHNISAYQNQSSHLMAKSREEEQIRIKTIAELQNQVQKYKLQNELNKQKVEKLQTKIQEINILQQKLKAVSAQKQQLLEKNNVLEAFMITQKHRLGYEVTQKIEEFQRNIHLLLQQDVKNISSLGGLQQIVVMKGYLKQLSELLQSQKKKVQKLKKKNEQLKIRVRQIEHQNTLKTTQFDKKIANYENLIQKQYTLLQQKILETQNMGNQRDYSNAISKYEQKMLKMTDQIIKLKKKNQTLQQASRSKAMSTVTEEEFERLNNVAANLQKDLERMQMQNRQLFEENRSLIETLREEGTEAKQIIKEKENRIEQILAKLSDCQQQLKLKQQKINQYIEMNKSYERQMKALHDQLQEHIETNNYLHNKYKDTDSLLEQVTNLEAEVRQLRNSHQLAIDYESARLVEHLQQLQNKINLQTQQIDAYKQENTYIYNELQSSKQIKQSMLLQHKSIVTELTNKIRQIQEMRQVQNIQRLQEAQKKTNLKQECQKLIQQNKNLACQIETLKEQMQTKRLSFESQISNIKAAKQDSQLEQPHQQLTHKSSKQIKELNSKMLTLRTENLAMKNELEEKEATISELKHQIYTRQLKMQKQKSKDNLLVGRQQTDKNNQNFEKLLLAFTLVSAQLDAIQRSQPTVETEVQTFVDCIVQKEIQSQIPCIPQQNITSLDYEQNQVKNKINLVAQPFNLEVHTTKSIETINQPASVIDSTWKEQYIKRKQSQKAELITKDFHGSAGSFRMIKLLKQSLKSIEDGSAKKAQTST